MLNTQISGLLSGGKTMRMYGLLVSAVLASCAAADPVVGPEEDGQSQTALEATEQLTDSLAQSRTLLIGRIDTGRLHLQPLTEIRPGQAFDSDALSAAMQAATGHVLEGGWNGTTFAASSALHEVTFDEQTGSLLIADTGNYEMGLTHATDEVFLATTQSLFNAVASDTSEALTEVKHLGATAREIGSDGEPVPARIGTKVFAFRTLGGLRVAGNRLVASYKTDGTLRTVRGLWPAIDLERSKLRSTLSVDEVVTRALDVLIAANARVLGDDPIAIETFYELQRTEDGEHVAVLRASALVQTLGPDGTPGRGARHDFDI